MIVAVFVAVMRLHSAWPGLLLRAGIENHSVKTHAPCAQDSNRSV